MLEITSIKNGFVIDHIEAGKGIKIFNHLKLNETDLSVALIMNAQSDRLGKKDIIKIEGIDNLDYTALAMLAPRVSVNEVRNEKIVNKFKPELPEVVEGILTCENERCITKDETYVPHTFKLVDRNLGTYRCEYCDHTSKLI
ncbi:MAG: aspartate carbamoyltransferase regulatory subunit [Clostridium sp.]|uniref:aspartate carbamoyltransferase regulatory subunit n=1 Tax=Clostridium TaxID=1485 RepID=UPI0018837D15|nr:MULTISPECIES: aspartate carbamoyltransferase regulatory subunit [Clostridium]MCR6515137.1 aspartate carbamoyltransferase regulatory subunit [Clostridium sp. LY3-2]